VRAPYLVVLAVSETCTHRRPPLLGEIDEVRFRPGPRSATRRMVGETRALELRIPDAWMSSQHGRLARSRGLGARRPRIEERLAIDAVVSQGVSPTARRSSRHTFCCSASSR